MPPRTFSQLPLPKPARKLHSAHLHSSSSKTFANVVNSNLSNKQTYIQFEHVRTTADMDGCHIISCKSMYSRRLSEENRPQESPASANHWGTSPSQSSPALLSEVASTGVKFMTLRHQPRARQPQVGAKQGLPIDAM